VLFSFNIITMGTATAVEQYLETNIDIKIKPLLDIALKNNCTSSVDSSQSMTNIKIDNAKNVTLEQQNQAKSLCNLKTTMDFLDKLNLSQDVMQKALDKIVTKGGIFGATSSADTKVITNIKTEIAPETRFNIQKECLQQAVASQKMDYIEITNSADVLLKQTNDTYNSCIQETATKQGYETDLAIASKQDATTDAKTTGFDPIASLLAMLGGPLILGGIGICICCCCCCVLLLMFGGFAAFSGGKGKPAAGSSTAPATGTRTRVA